VVEVPVAINNGGSVMGKSGDEEKRRQSEDYAGFFAEFQQESDRATAILGAAYLETRLGVLLRDYLLEGTNAVPYNFDRRIGLTRALGLIDRTDADQLNLIKEVRNQFAHQLHGLKFTSDEVAEKCSELARLYEAMPVQWEFGDLSDPRVAFMVAVTNLMTRLNNLIRGVEIGTILSPSNTQ
jgi:hypothetical protein